MKKEQNNKKIRAIILLIAFYLLAVPAQVQPARAAAAGSNVELIISPWPGGIQMQGTVMDNVVADGDYVYFRTAQFGGPAIAKFNAKTLTATAIGDTWPFEQPVGVIQGGIITQLKDYYSKIPDKIRIIRFADNARFSTNGQFKGADGTFVFVDSNILNNTLGTVANVPFSFERGIKLTGSDLIYINGKNIMSGNITNGKENWRREAVYLFSDGDKIIISDNNNVIATDFSGHEIWKDDKNINGIQSGINGGDGKYYLVGNKKLTVLRDDGKGLMQLNLTTQPAQIAKTNSGIWLTNGGSNVVLINDDGTEIKPILPEKVVRLQELGMGGPWHYRIYSAAGRLFLDMDQYNLLIEKEIAQPPKPAVSSTAGTGIPTVNQNTILALILFIVAGAGLIYVARKRPKQRT